MSASASKLILLSETNAKAQLLWILTGWVLFPCLRKLWGLGDFSSIETSSHKIQTDKSIPRFSDVIE